MEEIETETEGKDYGFEEITKKYIKEKVRKKKTEYTLNQGLSANQGGSGVTIQRRDFFPILCRYSTTRKQCIIGG